ncbi:hypothetical protein ACNITJ_25810, partial [Escherichia coli]
QFLDVIADGPVPFLYPACDYHSVLLPGSLSTLAVKCAGVART